MVLIPHILIALSSLVWGSVLLVWPSKSKFYAYYGLIALTLSSGTYLVLTTHANLVQSCGSGIAYLAVVSGLLVAAHSRSRLVPDVSI